MMAHAEKLEFEQAAELRNQMSALSKVLHQQSMEIASTRTSTSWPSRCRAARPASTWRWCAAAGTWATAPTFPSHVEDATGAAWRLDATTGRGARRGAPIEVQVLEAFIAQHYIGVPVPPRWC
jgi:excinuclease ABC subunit C